MDWTKNRKLPDLQETPELSPEPPGCLVARHVQHPAAVDVLKRKSHSISDLKELDSTLGFSALE